MKSNSTKRSLKTSGLALLLCVLMLIGTTFAWFTDSITNSGNKIQAGSLDIGAMAYDIAAEGDKAVTIPGVNGDQPFKFATEGKDLEAKDAPAIISETLWEPGISNAKLLQVTNKGTLAAKIKLSFDVKDGGLQDALWFDFIQLGENNEVTGTFTKRPMSELQQLADGVEVSLKANKSVRFVLVYGMNENADNTYQGKEFSANVIINAAQLNSEKDGFGSPDYDKEAEYAPIKVGSGEELVKAIKELKEGDKLKAELVKDIEVKETFRAPKNTEVVIDGNKKEISMADNKEENKNTVVNLGKMTIKECTIINKDTGNTVGVGGSNAALASAGELILENCIFKNYSGISGAYSVVIDGGTAEIRNCEIYGTRGGLAIAEDAEVKVIGGKISAAYYYPITAYGNGHSVCEGVTFEKHPKLESQSGNGGNALIYNGFEPEKYGDKGTLTFNNCHFISTRTEGSSLEIFNNFNSLSLNDCIYDNVTNIQ